MTSTQRTGFSILIIFSLITLSCGAYSAEDLAYMSSTITGNFNNLSKLISAGSYIIGLAFAITSIMKFKAHKDNPTQIPVGTPIALSMIAASLLFLPSMLEVTAQTLFGGEASVATSTGLAWVPAVESSTESSSSSLSAKQQAQLKTLKTLKKIKGLSNKQKKKLKKLKTQGFGG